MSEKTFKLKFEAGTLILEGAEENDFVPNAFVWDKRTRQFRSPAFKYRQIIKEFIRAKTAYEDAAKRYDSFAFKQKFHIAPRPYQTASVEAWRANERCGVIVLPTGAGKTHVATMAIEMCGRQMMTLVENHQTELVAQSFLMAKSRSVSRDGNRADFVKAAADQPDFRVEC